MASRRLTLFIALVLASSWAWAQDEEPVPNYCRIRLLIDPKVSGFVLRGTNSLIPPRGAALNAPITMVAGQRTAYVGALYVSFPLTGNATTCPSDAAELTAALQNTTWRTNGFDFSYPAASQGITMYPSQILGLTAGQAYQPQNLLWNLTTYSVVISPSGAISLNGNSSVLQGYLYTENLLTGNRYDSIAGSSGSFAATGTISVQRGVVTVQLSSFNVTTVGRGELQLGGTLYTSVTTLNFVGNLTMKTNLACPTYCGDAGRCYKMSHNTTTCRCDCGWNRDLRTGACTLATGWCDPRMRPN